MRTCPPRVFESAQRSFDVALRSALERIVTASGPGFGDWQWRLATLPFAFGGLGVYSAGDVLNYAFLASRLQSVALQTKLLRHVSIVSSGSTFDDALSVFNTSMEIDLLSIPSEIAAPKLMKKMADIYFTRVTKDAVSTFSLSSRQMALWKSQMEDHTSDWLRVVPISGLGQTMNGRTYRLLQGLYGGYLWGHAMSCAGIVGIKHRHNVVRDTLVDICYRSGISSGKEVDIGLSGERDKSLRPADVLLYSWDGGRDVCVDLTGSSPLTQTGMVDFVPGRAVLVAAQRKRAKYETKCADIGYGFLPFSFSSFGELEKDAVTLLKRIRKFSVAQDIGARAAIHIFSRICFAIAKGSVASHPETKMRFLNAQIHLYLYPLLNITDMTRPLEYLRLISFSVIGALVKDNDTEVISILLPTELIPLCLRTIEMGSEMTKCVATFIIQRILSDSGGLNFMCRTAERFVETSRVLRSMVAAQPTSRLFKHIIRCYLLLSQNSRACDALKGSLPNALLDGTFSPILSEDHTTRGWLHQLLINLRGRR
ncbi:RNA-directed DNA polymerase, eukaryota [Tanacetum coccineum]|uniref:RNA-directed DNA polymerase, eukaryota n=1 Tax=Tanacetum coccineum TaxID=301880 RepID=A0ABQ4XCL4_9ASTR